MTRPCLSLTLQPQPLLPRIWQSLLEKESLVLSLWVGSLPWKPMGKSLVSASVSFPTLSFLQLSLAGECWPHQQSRTFVSYFFISTSQMVFFPLLYYHLLGILMIVQINTNTHFLWAAFSIMILLIRVNLLFFFMLSIKTILKWNAWNSDDSKELKSVVWQ